MSRGNANALRNLLAAGLALQGIAVIGWWSLLWIVPDSREWFVPAEWDPWPLLGFWLADIVALAIPSLIAAAGMATRWPGVVRVLWITSGCWLYATLLCFEAALRLPGGWLGTALMGTAAGFALGVAGTIQSREVYLFRAVPLSRHWMLTAARTFSQITYCWILFLGAWPLAIVEVQRRALERVEWLWLGNGAVAVMGWTIFVLAGPLGLTSAAYMVAVGRGTPLPTACPSGLVVAGPYRFVRNPMAIAGILQGVGVGMIVGSVLVVGYAICGAVVWQFVVRPMEERDLRARFGEAYETYRSEVRCWWPRASPYGLSHPSRTNA